MNCVECGNPIPIGRLEALLGVRTCVHCSKATPKVGLSLYNNDVCEVMMVDKEEANAFLEEHPYSVK